MVALAGGERKLNVVRELGAEASVDYLLADWPRQVREAVDSVDVVFDGVGGAIGLDALGLLGAGGRFCPFGMASGAFTAVFGDLTAARGISVLRSARPSPDQLLELTRAALREAQLGRLGPVIGQQFALEDAAAAHAAIEARAGIGKSLLAIGGPG
jgi:NADPH2:quinone reductase